MTAQGFDCGEPSLNRFLRETARQYADRDFGVTYVAIPEVGSSQILGYYTMTMAEIASEVIPQKGLPSRQPIPVALLGRLAVDLGTQGNRVGERLLFDALSNTQQISSRIGCFAVVVDALTESAKNFYLRYGFVVLSDEPASLIHDAEGHPQNGFVSLRTNLLMRRPNLLNLPPLPALPDGYSLRETQPEDTPGLAAVLDRAFASDTWDLARSWDEARVAATLNEEQGVKQTLVVDFGGRPIATASARLQPDRFPGSGYLHWVAVDPDHRGQRLGFFLSLAVLHTFRTLGCADALLETQDHRLAAIKTYLKLGFLPEYQDETHRERWTTISSALNSDIAV